MRRELTLGLTLVPLAIVVLGLILQSNYLGSDCTVVFHTYTQPDVSCAYHWRVQWLAPISQEWIISNLFAFALLAGGFEIGYYYRKLNP
jgi:hypothetical protein